jgi:c(7)-type cytochrome triheme protein
MAPREALRGKLARTFGPAHFAVAFLLTITLVVPGGAQTLTKLPSDLALPRGETSPGTVTFRHLTHIDESKPVCTACHPGLFKMLTKERPSADGTLFHEEMQNGRKCGACHDGSAAFGLDNCPICHLEE